MPGIERLQELIDAINPLREQLVGHPVYGEMNSLQDLRVFMQHHVYAVWDFMTLLTALQRRFTCVKVPWVPQGDPEVRRLINEILIEEESDEAPDGGYASHYELYLAAMEETGADTSAITALIDRLRSGESLETAITDPSIPPAASEFAQETWRVVQSHAPHQIAAAFTLGREDLIPDMFKKLVQGLHARFPSQLDRFVYYLERHIGLDEDRHGPMSLRMLSLLCGDDETKWNDAEPAATSALQTRIRLWDAVTQALPRTKSAACV